MGKCCERKGETCHYDYLTVLKANVVEEKLPVEANERTRGKTNEGDRVLKSHESAQKFGSLWTEGSESE